MRKREAIGTFLALVTAVISGFSIFANKWFVVDLEPAVFTAVRAVIVGLVFLILSFAFGSWKRKERSSLNWGALFVIGIIGGGIAFLLFFSGLKLTTVGRAAFLNKTLPIYVTLFAFIFLKEKISKKQIGALVLMIAGTIVLVSATISPRILWLNPELGDVLIVAAAVLWAIESVIAKKIMRDGEHNFVVSFARMFFGAVFLFGFLFVVGKLDELAVLTARQWFNILISTALLFGYVLTFYWSIRYINVSKAATILLLAPIITLILGVVFFGEPLPALQIVGSVLILVGAYFVVGTKSEFVRE
jgi:drug/metabolite transporter (DMT)-like permease